MKCDLCMTFDPHLQVAIGSDPESVAGGAEVVAHGGDEPDVPSKPRHLVRLYMYIVHGNDTLMEDTTPRQPLNEVATVIIEYVHVHNISTCNCISSAESHMVMYLVMV